MSSNMELRRVCHHCGIHFIAKKTGTKFCSLKCGQKNYKLRERINKINASKASSKPELSQPYKPIEKPYAPEIEFINIKMLALVIGVSERTLFRLIKDNDLPRLKIGRRLLFHRKTVIDYISNKYGLLL